MEKIGSQFTDFFNKTERRDKYRELLEKVLTDPDVHAFTTKYQAELAPNYKKADFSTFYEYVTVRDKLARGEAVFAPGYEPVLKLVNHHANISYLPSEELKAIREQEAKDKRFEVLNMSKSVKKANLNDYQKDDPQRQEAFNKIVAFLDYVENPEEFHRGLYLYGKFGVGKTYLMAGLANHLANAGIEVAMIHMPSFAVAAKNAMGTSYTAEMITKLKKVPVLIMDDIGADNVSSWFRDDVLAIILQYRMQEQLPTFFTSNCSMEQLEKEYLTIDSRSQASPMHAQRIMERIRSLAEPQLMSGKNWRNPE